MRLLVLLSILASTASAQTIKTGGAQSSLLPDKVTVSTLNVTGQSTLSSPVQINSVAGETGQIVRISSQATNTILSVLGNGKVGIGTGAPAVAFEVLGTPVGLHSFVNIKGTAGQVGIDFETSAVGDAGRVRSDGVDMNFISPAAHVFWNGGDSGAGTANMKLTSGGSLGVGAANPASKLHMSSGTLTIDGTTPQIIVAPTAAEDIAAAATITANACGAIKRISATGAQTTNTTNTFTAPDGSNAGCCMDVINVDTADAITLDTNANFFSAGAADVVLGIRDTVRVCSDGTVWTQVGATGNN